MGRQSQKVFYTSLELLLILLTIVGGMRLNLVLPMFLVIRGCLIFHLLGRLVVTGLAFMSFLIIVLWRSFPPIPAYEHRPLTLSIVLPGLLLNGLILVFVLVLMNFMLFERRSREKLTTAHEQLRQYSLRIEDQAMLQERNRIGRDIHDSLGHSLTALNLQLEAALKIWSTDATKALKFVSEAKQLGSTALREVRQSVATLRADPLQGESLEKALASLAAEFDHATTTSLNWLLPPGRSIPPEIGIAIYRITQEALTNIRKHAAATEVRIQLSDTETRLILTIQDNGAGFKLDQNTTGFGLQSMRDRTLALGGRFEIQSAPVSGCRITADFPLLKWPQ